MICRQCGSDVQNDAQFCPVCGVRLEMQDYTGQTRQNAYQTYQDRQGYQYNTAETDRKTSFFSSLLHPEEQWDQDMYEEAYHFMAENQSFYGRRFQKLQAVRGTTDWNWCAFLFGGVWAFYRKMYIAGLIYLVATSVLACIPLIGWALSIALSICSGIWGNYIYMKHVQTSVCKYTRFSGDEKRLCYQSKGGTSVPAVFGAIGISILIASVPSLLIFALFGSLLWWL